MTKILISFAACVVLFSVAAIVGYRFLTRTIQTRLLAALGPEAVMDGVEVGPRTVTIKNLRIKGKGKGGQDPLTVERIVITPSLRSLPTGQIRLSTVELERPTVTITLQPGGRMDLPLPLPAPGPGESGGSQGPQVAIAQVLVRDGQIDLIDRTVPGRPVRLHFEGVGASVEELAVPPAPGKSPLEFEGVLRGRQANGRVKLSGWVEPITQDVSVKATLRSIDLTLFTPYMLQVEEAEVDRGRLDMDLDFQVRQRKVHAPGKAILSDLQLRSGPGVVSTFMGVPRQGVVNLLKNREGKIELTFRVEGDLSAHAFTSSSPSPPPWRRDWPSSSASV
jgi:hypothetical protein